MRSIAILGEYNPDFAPHADINEALRHSAGSLGMRINTHWISTAEVVNLDEFHGVLIAPGSPYASFEGALESIRHCREAGIPTLAACGGCQHLIIEYARNVLGYHEAHHAEYGPGSSTLFFTELVCSLAGKRMSVHFRPGSPHGNEPVEENYYCNFGLDPVYEQELERGGLSIEARDQDGKPRIFALLTHPFYVGTIFVPHAGSRLVDAFLLSQALAP